MFDSKRGDEIIQDNVGDDWNTSMKPTPAILAVLRGYETFYDSSQ